MNKKIIGALDNSVLIVAHPDDEVLWFSSLLGEIDHVVIVFQDYHADPGIGERRGKAITELPFDVSCLALKEAGSRLLADWSRPEISTYGLELNAHPSRSDVAKIYEENFWSICGSLRRQLSSDMNVFTHNPWGEYGHEDHVQVFRAVEKLRAEIGFALRVTAYFSERSRALVELYTDYGTIAPIRCPIDLGYAARVSEIYKRHRCWTWANDWEWPPDECFIGPPVLRGPLSTPPNFRLLYRVPSSVKERLPTRAPVVDRFD